MSVQNPYSELLIPLYPLWRRGRVAEGAPLLRDITKTPNLPKTTVNALLKATPSHTTQHEKTRTKHDSTLCFVQNPYNSRTNIFDLFQLTGGYYA